MVGKDADFGTAFERARACAGREHLPAPLEIRYNPDAIAPVAALSAMRKLALSRQHHG